MGGGTTARVAGPGFWAKVVAGVVAIGLAVTMTWESEPVGWASHPSWEIRARQPLVERGARRTILIDGRRLYRIRSVSVPSGFRFVRGVRRTDSLIALTYDVSPRATLGFRQITFFDGERRAIPCPRCIRVLEHGALAACPVVPGLRTIWGSNGPDYLTGGEGVDRLCGLGGDDVLIGDLGDDLLLGHSGWDEIYGEDGNDLLLGGSGGDALSGGLGNDAIGAGPGWDYLDGGSGNDRLNGVDGGRDRLLKGGTGTDRCRRDRVDPRRGCELT